jgi:hypothetical protein
MATQRVPGGQGGMVEVLALVSMHSESLHHPEGALVGESGEGDDLGEADPFEPMAQGRPGRFGGVPSSPCLAGQSPTHLDAGPKGEIPAGPGQSDEADEARTPLHFDRPEPEVARP